MIDRAPVTGGASEMTYEAVCYELRTYGVTALENPSCRRRLSDLSPEQLDRVIVAMIRMRGRNYCPGINDELFLALERLRQ